MEIIERYIINTNWITFICFDVFLLLVLARSISSYHFRNFMMLFATEKYVKIHGDDESRTSIHAVLTTFQFVAMPLFIFVIAYRLKIIEQIYFLDFLKLVGVYFAFFASRFFLERIVAFGFKINWALTAFWSERQTYQNYLSVLFFPITLILIYNSPLAEILAKPVAIIALILALFAFFVIIKHHRKHFYNAPFYFILYLCTFQIAPYIVAYLLITRSY